MVNYWINNENSFTLFTGQFPIQPSDKQQENSWFLTFNPERVGRKTKYILRPRKNTYNKLVQKVCFWFVPSARTFTCFYMERYFFFEGQNENYTFKRFTFKVDPVIRYLYNYSVLKSSLSHRNWVLPQAKILSSLSPVSKMNLSRV